MIISVPREVKSYEHRVALTVSGVHELSRRGHEVLVEDGAGVGSAITNDEYRSAGATIISDADDLWARADMVLKVKEPVQSEYHRLREGLILFTYLHLAAEESLTRALIDAGTTGIAYETVQTPDRRLPLLAPMSEVAGRLSVQAGAHALTAPAGGRGVLLGGVPGVPPAKVTVLGAGIAGTNAAAMAVGLGAEVSILDINVDRLRQLDAQYAGRLKTITSNALEVERAVVDSDLVIGSVLIPGAKAPKLVTDAMVQDMRPGSVLVDIAVDQGGCFENSRPTTHDNPTFPVHEALFYCVSNMPGAVPSTSTYALTNVTLPYVTLLAERGVSGALAANADLARGLNTLKGHVTHRSISDAHGLPYVDQTELLTPAAGKQTG
ncbi:alanine dehydrogenase [Nesterenkonia natronophila]|uniref:Alanine dehydrogenase n=1 Tax=Nesterenkonia natronophila TaxID=2174932 RepID=A0A3A4G2R5_9MICC|nr:alanine dehydrogenase [Nesterenkonia natronophila]RJN32479.1 alanine dehydrogenase [Nesterenkonia natronophila]